MLDALLKLLHLLEQGVDFIVTQLLIVISVDADFRARAAGVRLAACMACFSLAPSVLELIDASLKPGC